MEPLGTEQLETYKASEITAYNGLYNRYIKRGLGLGLAVIFLIPLLPIFVLIAVAIVIETGFPVLYTPERGGYKGQPFRIYKFRSMVKDADKIGGGTTALNDSRITKVGHFLRKTKLDEIPQLFNIIKGEMCFVGPRPELLQYTQAYQGAEEYILQVRPGITDYSSIEFINLDEIVGEEDADQMYEQYVLGQKNQLRITYAATVSFPTDVKLFWATIHHVIRKVWGFMFNTNRKDN